MDLEFKIIVLIMPEGMRVELEVSAEAPVEMLIDKLVKEPSLGIERINKFTLRPHNFVLTSKGMGRQLAGHETLYEAGVQNGDTLVLSQELFGC